MEASNRLSCNNPNCRYQNKAAYHVLDLPCTLDSLENLWRHHTGETSTDELLREKRKVAEKMQRAAEGR